MIVIPLSRPDAPPLPPSSRGGEASTATEPATRSAPRRRARRDTITPSPRATPSAASASSSSAPSSSSSSRQPTPDTPAIPPSSTCSSSPHRDLARVWEAVSTSRRIVVVTGAGISVSSPANIPDFRSSTGLFKTLKEQHPNAGLSSGKDLFDARLFQSEANTALFYSMIAQLHDMTLKAKPTLFHHLIKRLDEQGRLQRVYTQNIDALEERTGLTFGLGNGARKTFQRTASLGKRKRLAAAAAASAETANAAAGGDANGPPTRPRWSKTQSAPVHSHLLGGADDSEPATAMFPRVIPLHGSLAHLVCTACDFRLSTLPEPTPQVQAALKELAEGETPACPACSERESVRIAAGLRSRGIGFLKPDVVLYNGDNKSGERVGECLERDVLGLRDRLDGQVPETYAEERARLRKEEKAMATAAQKQQQQQNVAPPAATSTLMSISESSSSIASLGSSAEDVLGQAFEEDEEEDKAMVARDLGAAPTNTTSSNSSSTSSPAAKLFQDVRAKRSLKRATTQPAPVPSSAATTSTNPKKAAPLKPLPPDLLIVAGTSLKVPGTKRVVREFAKAARARDGIVPKGCATAARSKANASSSSRENSKTPSNSSASAKTSRSGSWESAEASDEGSDAGSDEEDEDEAGEDGTDPTRPIRTILLNYDFPVPSKEWEDIFDVWVQGDVQAAAGGLWSASAGYGSGNAIGVAAEGEGDGEESTIDGVRSWDLSLDELEATRSDLKKAEREEKRALRLQEVDGARASSSSSSTSRARPRTSKQAATTFSSSRSIKVEDEMEEDESSPRRPSSRARLNSPTVLIPKMTISDSGDVGGSTKKKNLGPSAKTNGVDKMFPPAKRATSGASRGGAKAGGAKQGSDAGAGAGRASRGRTSSTSGSTRKASTARGSA